MVGRPDGTRYEGATVPRTSDTPLTRGAWHFMVQRTGVHHGEARVKPYDRLTIIRNRHRARDLRTFRRHVRAYFEQFEYEAEDVPFDLESTRIARAEINQMLPRIVQIVRAADLSASTSGSRRNPAARAVEIVETLFSAPRSAGAYQQILDVIDMAIGVYDANRYGALMRTFNPFHYLMTALGYLAGLPKRGLVALGFLRPHSARIGPGDVTRFEAALSRLENVDSLIETRFAEMREWQSRLFAESADQIGDVAERMDFVERVLAQQPPTPWLKPGKKDVSTPV